jgi:hypothetical protein
MKVVQLIFAMATSGIAFGSISSHVVAQQVTGVLGSPEATATIDGKQLPPPDPKFGGVTAQPSHSIFPTSVSQMA